MIQPAYNPYNQKYESCPPCKGTGLVSDGRKICLRCKGKGVIYNKTGARKTEYKGVIYDSFKEAEKAMYLDQLKTTGEVIEWSYHPTYNVIPRFYKYGKLFRPARYEADFLVHFKEGSASHKQYGKTVVVIDTKGWETEAWRLKRKLFEWQYPDIVLSIE